MQPYLHEELAEDVLRFVGPYFKVAAVTRDEDDKFWEVWSWGVVAGTDPMPSPVLAFSSGVAAAMVSDDDDSDEEGFRSLRGAESGDSSEPRTDMSLATTEDEDEDEDDEDEEDWPAYSLGRPVAQRLKLRSWRYLAIELHAALAEIAAGGRLATCFEGGRATLWDLAGEREPVELGYSKETAMDDARGISFFPDGDKVVTWQHVMEYTDKSAIPKRRTQVRALVWNASSGMLLHTLASPQDFDGHTILRTYIGHRGVRVFPRGDKLLVVYSGDLDDVGHLARVYDAETGKVLRDRRFTQTGVLWRAEVTAQLAAPLGDDQVVFLQRTSGGWTIFDVEGGGEQVVDAGGGVPLCASENGELVAQVNGDIRQGVFEAPTAFVVRETRTGDVRHRLQFSDIVEHIGRPWFAIRRDVRADFSPDGEKVIIYADKERSVHFVWFLHDNDRPIWSPPRQKPHHHGKFTSDSRYIALAPKHVFHKGSPRLTIHEASTGQVMRELAIDAFTPEGRRRFLAAYAVDVIDGSAPS